MKKWKVSIIIRGRPLVLHLYQEAADEEQAKRVILAKLNQLFAFFPKTRDQLEIAIVEEIK